MLLGAAKYLAETRRFDGTVCFIFQPAEENEAGGRVMVEEGLFEQFPVDDVYGMHNIPGLAAGKMAVRPGPMMAAADFFEIRITGRGAQGWRLITSQLNHERVTLCSPGMLEQGYEEVLRWALSAKLSDGRRVIDQEWVQINLARVHAGLEFLRLLNWKVAWTATHGKLDVADASSIKVFGTEFYLEAFRLLMEIQGPRGYLQQESADSLERGSLETL